MMWVKLTLPPRVRARWLFRTRRLTSSSRAGTTRKLVAVGTPSDASMLLAVLAAAPRSGVPTATLGLGAGLAGVGAAGAAGGAGFSAAAVVTSPLVPPFRDGL